MQVFDINLITKIKADIFKDIQLQKDTENYDKFLELHEKIYNALSDYGFTEPLDFADVVAYFSIHFYTLLEEGKYKEEIQKLILSLIKTNQTVSSGLEASIANLIDENLEVKDKEEFFNQYKELLANHINSKDDYFFEVVKKANEENMAEYLGLIKPHTQKKKIIRRKCIDLITRFYDKNIEISEKGLKILNILEDFANKEITMNRNRYEDIKKLYEDLQLDSNLKFVNKDATINRLLVVKYKTKTQELIKELQQLKESITINGVKKRVNLYLLGLTAYKLKTISQEYTTFKTLVSDALQENLLTCPNVYTEEHKLLLTLNLIAALKNKTQEDIQFYKTNLSNYVIREQEALLNNSTFCINEDITQILNNLMAIINYNSQQEAICEDQLNTKENNETIKPLNNQVTPPKKENPLEKYVKNGKIIQLCDLETFQTLLENSSLSGTMKENYYRQMKNAFANQAYEEKMQKISQIREEIMSDQELQCYRIAKQSSLFEVSQILRDIDDLLEIYLEENDVNTLEEIKQEIKNQLEILRQILNIKEEEEKVSPVIYYKNQNNIPIIEQQLKNLPKGTYKAFYTEWNKLLEQKTIGDREVQGIHLVNPVYAKGKDIKIFYTKLKDYILILSCYQGENGYKNIVNLIQRPDFIQFYEELKQDLNEGKQVDHSAYSEDILTILSTSKQVSLRLKKQ